MESEVFLEWIDYTHSPVPSMSNKPVTNDSQIGVQQTILSTIIVFKNINKENENDEKNPDFGPGMTSFGKTSNFLHENL